MNSLESPSISNMGVTLDQSPEVFGELRRSDNIAFDGAALRERIAEDGYLYLPGYLNREDVLQVRREVLEKLAAEGQLDPDYPLMDGVARPGSELAYSPDLIANSSAIHQVLYKGPMMELMRRFFDESVLHFNYTWFRTMSQGKATPPHCDVVFMGRGSAQLHTAWVPYGDVSRDLGGLMLLENSHLVTPKLRAEYLAKDVDTYCVNDATRNEDKPNNWLFDGALDHDPVHIRSELGGRWLTADYEAGDLILFGMAMVHAGLDNNTNRLRLSSDSRYQKASEPADERWIGENPPGHGPHVHKEVIC